MNIAPKDLIIQNTTLEGTYRATQSITLGENLSYQPSTIVLRSPNIIIPQNVDVPASTPIILDPEVCENE